MKVWSDTLTRADLYACLPADVGIGEMRELRNPRKRARGWDLHLEGYGTRHTRRRNTGQYGAASSAYFNAATWDDHGVWMAALYEIDPDAAIAWYDNRADFYAKTEREMRWRRTAKRGSRASAPWLEGTTARLEYLRGELRAERISYGELLELQNLTHVIDPSDVELLEAAGVPEFEEAPA